MRTIIWFVYFWLYLVCLLPPLFLVKRAGKAGRVEEHDRKVRLHTERWAKRLLWMAGAKITVTGRENIPEGPVVFTSNHQGYFDIPLMISQLDKQNPLVAKIEIKKIPMIRTWMKEMQCIFIDRHDPRQSMNCLKQAQELLTQGYSVVIFPEGTRNRGGELREFKAGGIRIATKTKLPIVPVCISGTSRLMENNKMWIHPAKVTMKILPPIYTENLTHEEIKALPESLRLLVQENLKGLVEGDCK